MGLEARLFGAAPCGVKGGSETIVQAAICRFGCLIRCTWK